VKSIHPFGCAVAGALVMACSSASTVSLPATDDTCAGPCPVTNVKHLVVIIQENHTFDGQFGGYCTAPAGSNPSCTDGPSCCEAAPAADPSGHLSVVLNDEEMGGHDPDHTLKCETEEMNGGKMDAYAAASCGSARNVAYADARIVKPYWDLAADGALADRYFQPIIGESDASMMYFARAGFVFNDNELGPKSAIGITCGISAPQHEFTDTTIGDLLTAKGVPWSFFAGGYKAMSDAVAAGTCPAIPEECVAHLPLYPCIMDPADIPIEYYESTRDSPDVMKDLSAFTSALDSGALPAVAFVRAIGYESEHPGLRNTLSAGVKFVTGIVSAVMQSRYRESALVLFTYDEGGGYFDHVTPPPPSAADGKPYGTRVPMVAIGKFARKGSVSHVTMEHSSVVKFIEYNWLGGETGQLGTRDAIVSNLGSLLDPAATGARVPE
jgi:phospholipase C